jgi:hypothetical protein
VKYHFNARWYDAETARFISEDPARDGVSWFAYVGNNPLRFVDPSGKIMIDELDPGLADTPNNELRATYYEDLDLDRPLVMPSNAGSRERAVIERFMESSEGGELFETGRRIVGNGINTTEEERITAATGYDRAITWLYELGMIWPTQGTLTTIYDDPLYPFPSPHFRLDIANVEGTRVVAPFDGEIISIFENEDDKGYGLEIMRDDGLIARLIHFMERPYWEVGDNVQIGQQVGFIGNTGLSTGPHLDFLLYQDAPTPSQANSAEFSIDPRLILGWVERDGVITW